MIKLIIMPLAALMLMVTVMHIQEIALYTPMSSIIQHTRMRQ
jgi:hypothetical protein